MVDTRRARLPSGRSSKSLRRRSPIVRGRYSAGRMTFAPRSILSVRSKPLGGGRGTRPPFGLLARTHGCQPIAVPRQLHPPLTLNLAVDLAISSHVSLI